ncbi:DUF6586 family protein [Alkalimarinus alittae]|uniref:Uncharacterized protein n=1 Tax=Alkalimarinus alittae TaxID=2961619 RepID=A0ABY6MYJ2_9ALTE|nr:DUF6586 family protein [Alkalimarinus alittae]UZE94834.1 hypothetical protein NKI27_12175 [Alkalimarinus alittae]
MNKWQSQTSQKLYLADIQLQAWQEFNLASTAVFKPRDESHKQSSILLMSAAWSSLVNELAEYHQRPSDLSMTLERLVSEIGNELPEIEYLTELSKVQGSWVSDLRKNDLLVRLPKSREPASEEQDLASNALIATSGAATEVDSIENLKRILGEFKSYLEDLRSRMSEW